MVFPKEVLGVCPHRVTSGSTRFNPTFCETISRLLTRYWGSMNLIGYVGGKLWNEHGTWNRFPSDPSSSWSVVSGPVTTVGGTRCLLCVGCLAKSLVYTHSECVLPFAQFTHACMHVSYVCMYVCMCGLWVWVWVCVYVCVCMWTYSLSELHIYSSLPFVFILFVSGLTFISERHSNSRFLFTTLLTAPTDMPTWLLQIVGWNFQLPLGLPSSLTELNFSSYGETWWEFHQQSLSINWTQPLL